jgi:hypothetical protein
MMRTSPAASFFFELCFFGSAGSDSADCWLRVGRRLATNFFTLPLTFGGIVSGQFSKAIGGVVDRDHDLVEQRDRFLGGGVGRCGTAAAPGDLDL